MIPYQWFTQAHERISPHIHTTPLTYDQSLGVYFKWENHQITGSFKARGAFNKVLSLEPWERQAGLIAASAGNHGQGVALVGKQFGVPVRIFASDSASPLKIDAMRALGAEVTLIPGGYGDAEKAGLAYAAQGTGTWISPYNDPQVIAGQGTLALEVFQQAKENFQDALQQATWLVPTSGGGLLAGIARVVRQLAPDARIIGIQSDTSPFMHALFYQGSQDGVQELPTIADGLAGPVEPGSITIPLIRHYVDQILLVSEADTTRALAYTWHHYGQMIEGSAAVVIAAILTQAFPGEPLIAVLSGGNIQPSLFQEIIASET
jgi:threonine dehydratase